MLLLLLFLLLLVQGFALGTMQKVGPDHTDNDGHELAAAGETSWFDAFHWLA
jgi:hypothetical protein